MFESTTRGTVCRKCNTPYPTDNDHECAPTQSRTMAQAFNEWMRRYTDEPERFAADFRTCGEFLAEAARGEEPSYGETCAVYLADLMIEEVPFFRAAAIGTFAGARTMGATLHRADGSEIKAGDSVIAGESLTFKIATDAIGVP